MNLSPHFTLKNDSSTLKGNAMKKLLLTLAAFAALAASAADLQLSPGQSAYTTVTAVCTSCPPPPPPVEVVKEVIKEVPVVKEVPVAVKMAGNAHAVYHPDSVAKNGYAKCQECHNQTSTTPAKVSSAGSFICSQYQFCSSGTIGGKTDCKTGLTFTNSLTGALLADPVTKEIIVSGGKVGGYSEGMIPQCRDCHYPHKTIKEPPKSSIHAGCLDCHMGVKNSDVKKGIKK